jgi:hypothetical protein
LIGKEVFYLKRKYSVTSILLSIIGLLSLFIAHFISNGNGELTSSQVTVIYFVGIFGLISLISGIVCGILAIKTREIGKVKYAGLSIISIFTIGFLAILLIFAIGLTSF